jgi:hypothetical protein
MVGRWQMGVAVHQEVKGVGVVAVHQEVKGVRAAAAVHQKVKGVGVVAVEGLGV